MRFIVNVLLVGILAQVTFGCELHDAMRRAAARQALEEPENERHLLHLANLERIQAQERARADVRESIYGLHGSERSNSYIRQEVPVQQPYYSSLPEGMKFCDGGREYFCSEESTCVPNGDGSYRCRRERTYLPETKVVRTGNRVVTTRTRPTIRVPVESRRYYYPTSSSYPSSNTYPRLSSRKTYTHYQYPVKPSYTRYTSSRYPIPNYRIPRVTTCPTGFEKVNVTNTRFRCEDIDECDTEENKCEHTCKNFQGGFTCLCDKGYVKEEKFGCRDRDECEIEGICGLECLNTNGSYECLCTDGYIRDDAIPGGKDCKDVDECESDPCMANQTCFNKQGSYECEELPECPDDYMMIRKNGTEGSCVLEDNTLASRDIPNYIMYRKLAVETKESTRYFGREIAQFHFSSKDQYSHHYSVEELEGRGNFTHSTRSYGRSLIVSIRTTKTLIPNEPYYYTLLITDTPRAISYGSYYHYGRRPAIPRSTRRRFELTMIPMKFPRRKIVPR